MKLNVMTYKMRHRLFTPRMSRKRAFKKRRLKRAVAAFVAYCKMFNKYLIKKENGNQG